VERGTGRRTQHGFSFGAHYDPEWLSFGPMVCHDDHLLGSGQGFDEHPHSDLEIVTYAVSGSLVHTDSLGTSAALEAGEVAVLSSGSGVRHSELAPPTGAARFVQVWLRPDAVGTAPTYARGSTEAAVPGAGLVPIAGAGTSLAVGVAGASYAVARLAVGEKLILRPAARQHVYVASGSLTRSSLAAPLEAGDAFCFVDEPTHQVTAAVATELLVWSFTS
jgi:redox-sensitive bicupin YhaK (pirin superfamily)